MTRQNVRTKMRQTSTTVIHEGLRGAQPILTETEVTEVTEVTEAVDVHTTWLTENRVILECYSTF